MFALTKRLQDFISSRPQFKNKKKSCEIRVQYLHIIQVIFLFIDDVGLYIYFHRTISVTYLWPWKLIDVGWWYERGTRSILSTSICKWYFLFLMHLFVKGIVDSSTTLLTHTFGNKWLIHIPSSLPWNRDCSKELCVTSSTRESLV